MTIVVTRHKALVQFLVKRKMIGANTPIIAHATEKDVRDKDVIGVLPLRLAALAASVTEVPMDIPAELRGQELSLEQVEAFSGEPVKYTVGRTGLWVVVERGV